MDNNSFSNHRNMTNPGMMRLLKQSTLSEKSGLLQFNKGQISLIPSLVINKNSYAVSFRIGSERNYVLKNVEEFYEHMDNCDLFSYGKGLSFYHHISAFDDTSKPLVNLLLRSVGKYVKAREDWRNYRGNFKTADQLRYWPISEEELGEILDLSQGRSIEIALDGKKAASFSINEGKLRHQLYMTGKDSMGLVLRLESPRIFKSQNYNYYLSGQTILCAPRKAKSLSDDFIAYLQTMPKCICPIGSRDLPIFCQNMLPELKEDCDFIYDNFDPEQYLPREGQFKIYLDYPQDDMIICRLEVIYFSQTFNPFADYAKRMGARGDGLKLLMQKGASDAFRDFSRENMICETLIPMFSSYDARSGMICLQGDNDVISDFLCNKLPIINTLGEVYISDNLKNLLKPRHYRINVGVSLTSGLLNLSADTSGISNEELADIFSHYEKKKKYYRFKDGSYINLQDDKSLSKFYETTKVLDIDPKKVLEGGVNLPAYRSLYLDQNLNSEDGIAVKKDKNYRSIIRSMKTIDESDYEIPPSLEGVLREYQKTGFRFLSTLYHNGFGGILADDMGLGKTLQVIAFLLAQMEEEGNHRTLIVCPASLIYNWNQEIEKFAPGLHHTMLTGNAAARRKQILLSKEDEILITSYDQLKRDVDCYKEIPFFCQILDEAQYIKNQTTIAAKACKMIDSGFRLALTGTPIENRLSELWSIFDYLMPGFLYKYSKFRSEYETPIINARERSRMQENEAATDDHAAKLQKLIRPFILRRLKRDVLKDLPEKLEENICTPMTGEQRKLYEAHAERLKKMLAESSEQEFSKAKLKILAELTRLRQVCCNPAMIYENYKGGSGKLDTCMELIDQSLEGGHKLLLFSQFTSNFPVIEKLLDEKKIPYLKLTGANSKKERAEMVEEFQIGEIPVFMISLKAGGTGLNLTAADVVIHLDPWWNFAAQNQATDRVYRIGQENPVSVFKLITKNTIEERIQGLQLAKHDLAESILGGEGFESGDFSADELMELLQ